MLGLIPLVAIGCFALWGLVLLLSRTISVASIAACIAAPIAAYLTRQNVPTVGVVTLFCLVGLAKHIPNMKRLQAGTEPKIGQKKTESSTRSEEQNRTNTAVTKP
jgi:glycerol-3-phosphate acyltransferase PlsY